MHKQLSIHHIFETEPTDAFTLCFNLRNTDRKSTSTKWHRITIICYWQLGTVHLQSPFLVNAWIQLNRRYTVFRWCTDFLHFKPHEHFVDNLYNKAHWCSNTASRFLVYVGLSKLILTC